MRRLSVLALAAFVAIGVLSAPSAQAAPVRPAPQATRAYAAAPKLPRAAVTDALADARGGPAVRFAHLDSELGRFVNSPKSVEVDIRGNATAAAAAVREAGGVVHAQIAGALTATVPGTRLLALSATKGITELKAPERPVQEAVSQGVGLSNASAWQAAMPTNFNGTGVKVAVIDDDYANLIPADGTLQSSPSCSEPGVDGHGSAVAEIVHEMAPGATILLYCVDDSVAINAAEQAAVVAGVKIITTSLGFPGDGRGDGSTSDPTSVTNAVRDARKHGVLWINAAGNQAENHWSGSMVDRNGDQLVDINGTGTDSNNNDEESDQDFVLPNGSAGVTVAWDQWPTSNLDVLVILFGYDCESATTCDDPTSIFGYDPSTGLPIPEVEEQTPGTSPVLGIDISNPGGHLQRWIAYIAVPSSQPGVHYDLTWDGDVIPSYLATINPARAATGSIDSVSATPWVMAVGAGDASGADSCDSDTTSATGVPLEAYSSQGPTIDGRSKPDILGYDGTASSFFGGVFCGTSAASPHVAGAAAILAQANPALDASQLEYTLEQRADHGTPINPANNSVGHGVLTLGDPAGGAPAPTGSTYTPLGAPVRVLDTRDGTGRPGGAVGEIPSNSAISVAIPTSVVPANATAVSLNVTGLFVKGQAGATYLGVFPGGTTWPGTSNVNPRTPTDSTAGASTIVAIGPGGVVQVQNGGLAVHAILDVTGYFTAATSGLKYTAVAPFRAYTGQPSTFLNPGQTVVVTPAVPAGTQSVLINLAAAGPRGTGFFNVSPAPNITSSAVNYEKGYDRDNMAIVALDENGSFTISGGGLAGAIPIVDVDGYFGASGASFYPLASPQRIIDTRFGNGGRKAPIGARVTDDAFVAGLSGVPYSASAIVAGVAVIDRTGTTYVTAYSGSGSPPLAATVNATAGRVVPNGATIVTANNSVGIYNNVGSIDLVVDLFGYFN